MGKKQLVHTGGQPALALEVRFQPLKVSSYFRREGIPMPGPRLGMRDLQKACPETDRRKNSYYIKLRRPGISWR